MDVLEIKIGPQCKQYADFYDAERIKRQERTSISNTEEVRAVHITNEIQEQKFFKESEDFLYRSRIAD